MISSTWSRITQMVAATAAVLVFIWPLIISNENQAGLAQGIFIALMPLLLVLILVEYNSGSIGARQLAVLGVLIAVNSVIRLLGAGVSGIETVFFLIIIGAFVFGTGFGFVLASGSIFVSALLGAGVGPWLPFQMMAAGLVGIGGGCAGIVSRKLRLRGNLEIALMCAYAVIASFGYGALMTLWNWPLLAGQGGSLSYVAGAPLLQNLATFMKYEIVSGGLLWDLGRALTTVTLIALTGKTLLATLRRTANKAGISKL